MPHCFKSVACYRQGSNRYKFWVSGLQRWDRNRSTKFWVHHQARHNRSSVLRLRFVQRATTDSMIWVYSLWGINRYNHVLSLQSVRKETFTNTMFRIFVQQDNNRWSLFQAFMPERPIWIYQVLSVWGRSQTDICKKVKLNLHFKVLCKKVKLNLHFKVPSSAPTSEPHLRVPEYFSTLLMLQEISIPHTVASWVTL